MTRKTHIAFQIETTTGQTAITYGVKQTNMIAFTEQAAGPYCLGTIDALTTKFSADRKALAEEVAQLNTEIEALKRKRLGKIKTLVATAADSYATLEAAIAASPQLFEKPKTQTFAGIKVGFRKGTGGIDWDDDARVVALIKKHFPKAQAELLIKTKEKPIAKALADLDVSDLKKIGCRVEATGEVVFIKPTDSAVDKIVSALLKEATESEVAA
jgi:arsenate reductase-like glutaredoxin family protein